MEPIIMDGDMDNIMDDRDTLCFDPSVLNASTPSLGRDFEDLFFRPSSAPQLSDAMSCLSPSEMPNKSENDVPPAGSTPSDTRSDSPEDSSHSSSMDSPTGHLRNASLASNHSGLFSPDSTITERYIPSWPNADQFSLGEGAFFGQDNGNFSVRDDSTVEHDVESSNKAMASAFDFDSAASSPSPLKMELNTEKSKPTVFKQSFRTSSSTTFTGQPSDAGSLQQVSFLPSYHVVRLSVQRRLTVFLATHCRESICIPKSRRLYTAILWTRTLGWPCFTIQPRGCFWWNRYERWLAPLSHIISDFYL